MQEFAGKAQALTDLVEAEWHMIGHLQTNKAGKAAELFAAVDSVDSVKLAEKLDAAARNVGHKLGVLIEINVGGESAKSGVAPDSHELEELLPRRPTPRGPGISWPDDGPAIHRQSRRSAPVFPQAA